MPMNKYSLLFCCLSLILLSSCKKDIEINYHQVDPIYVVEASVSNEGMEARIRLTRVRYSFDETTPIRFSPGMFIKRGRPAPEAT